MQRYIEELEEVESHCSLRIFKKGQRMINPGRYDIGFNENYQMQKLCTLDHYQFYVHLAWNVLIFFLIICAVIFLIRLFLKSCENREALDLKENAQQFDLSVNKHVDRLETIYVCIKDDRLFGTDEAIIKKRYKKDIQEAYQFVMPLEEYIVFKRPQLIQMFADIKKILVD